MSTKKRPAAPPSKPVRTVVDGLPFDPFDRELPRGLRRYGVQLDKVRTVLAAPIEADAHGVDALRGHAWYRGGLRTPLFMLEGLARVSLGTDGDENVFRPLLDDVKIVEDVCGEVDYWFALLQRADAWQLPDAVRGSFADRHKAASGRLVGWLEARAWVDHRYLREEGTVRLRVNRLGRDLRDVAWPSAAKERKRLRAFLHDRMASLHTAARSLDMNDIEHGLHELRRKLRWISIYAAALDGAVQLDMRAKAPKGWARYMTPAVVDNPFNQLPEGEPGEEPVRIPAPLFYALSWLIAELGALKDRAQWTETVAHEHASLGLAPKSKRVIGDLSLEPAEAGRQAAAIVQRTLETDRLLERLAEALEA